MSLSPSPRRSLNLANVLQRRTFVVLCTVTAAALSGCGLASNLMHGLGIDMIPAEYDGFEEANVAVITVSDSSLYSNDVAAQQLSRRVGAILMREVDDVKLIREDQIEKWRDVNGWDAVDFVEIGKAVEADKVLGIELANLELRDGQTLYRGRCDVYVKVIDIATGKVEYTRTLDEFRYPTVAGQSTSETTESRFRALYLTMLAEEIGRSFHPYDMTDRIALDSAIASQ